jgi:hypothetical protein
MTREVFPIVFNRGTIICKLLAFISLMTVSAALIVLFLTEPATGYEISIYSVYPYSFWLLILTSIALGILILVVEASSLKESNWWLVGLTIVMVSNNTIFLLPLFRGYFTIDNYGVGNTDNLQHIGFIRDIQITGHFGAPMSSGENFYPAFHILILFMASITHINIELMLLFSSPFIYILYLVWLYLLSKEMTKDHNQSLLVTAFGSVPIFGSLYLVMKPMVFSFFILPLFLFLYFSSKESEAISCKVSFILLLITMPFYHPITGGIALLIVVLLCQASSHISERGIPTKKEKLNKLFERTIPFILFITWFSWLSLFRMFRWQAVAIWEALQGIGTSEASYSLLLGYNPIIPKLKIDEWLLHTTKTLGPVALYITLSVALLPNLLVKRKKSFAENHPFLLFLVLLFVIYILLIPASFLFSYAIGFVRMLLYTIFASILINGIALGSLLKYSKKRWAVFVLIILVLFISLPITVFNVHSSPWVLRANPQITHAEVWGMSWFMNYDSKEFLIDETFFKQQIMAMGLRGLQNIPFNIRKWPDSLAPDHFGYLRHDNYGALYKQDRYFISNTLSRIFYESVLPQYTHSWRWTPEDFKHLENDLTVDKVYCNVGFEVFYVRGIKQD